MASTRPDERVAAAVGLFEHAATRFERNRDVFMGSLLAGLPALCASGLFAGLHRYIRMSEGFYSTMHMLALMGFMALGRIRRPEGLQAAPPHRFVSRQRLCLRWTTDYWVNDALGRPFFVVSKTVTPGLGTVLLEDILPALLRDVPGQPSEAELAANPMLHRFVVVFDREGASPALFAKLWEQRVAAITYRKAVKDLWPEAEFVETEVESLGGNRTTMRLACRSTTFDSTTVSVSVKEVRRLTPDGHQTPIVKF